MLRNTQCNPVFCIFSFGVGATREPVLRNAQ
ncbi:hypothetical protein A2U01_0111789, partial [Trifolium medium]|nr:hypothetical protein [Trifolium medium]